MQISRYFRLKYDFFSRNVGGPFFQDCKLIVTGSLGYQFGSLYTTPRPDKVSLFLKIE